MSRIQPRQKLPHTHALHARAIARAAPRPWSEAVAALIALLASACTIAVAVSLALGLSI